MRSFARTTLVTIYHNFSHSDVSYRFNWKNVNVILECYFNHTEFDIKVSKLRNGIHVYGDCRVNPDSKDRHSTFLLIFWYSSRRITMEISSQRIRFSSKAVCFDIFNIDGQ